MPGSPEVTRGRIARARPAPLVVAVIALIATSCNRSDEPKVTSTPSITASATVVTPTATASAPALAPTELSITEFAVPEGTRPHDVAPAVDGGVWFTAQGSGQLGHLNPATGKTKLIDLGEGSAPHGVVVGPDGAPWITDSGLNAILRVDPATDKVTVFRVPAAGANLNTPTFDGEGLLWFTGQEGMYGRIDPKTKTGDTYIAPKGRGPYGIATAPDGTPWYSSLAGSYLARIDRKTGNAEVFDTPTPGGGARRVWSDSKGSLWITEWNAGKIARFQPATKQWKEWALPGASQPYAVFVDDQDIVWISDFGANAMVRFDPATETFQQLPIPSPNAAVRQILGRPGEVWGAESGASKLLLIKTRKS